MNKIIRYQLNNQDLPEKEGILNICAEGSDISGSGIICYKTKSGNISLLMHKNNKYGFITIDYLSSIKENLCFVGNCKNAAIENALEKGREVYHFKTYYQLREFYK